jgi:uncharacterized membrane protein YidH (DUF202 family)
LSVIFLDVIDFGNNGKKSCVMSMTTVETAGVPPDRLQAPNAVLFDEALAPSEALAASLDFARLQALRWLPLKVENGRAWIITPRDDLDAVKDEARALLGVEASDISKATDSALTRFIEHAQDINPGFPLESGRTILARTRTFLADKRSQFASYRTLLAKGRTGLATLRTGIALTTVSLILIKVFGFAGLVIIPEGMLMILGVIMLIDGLIWYIPCRRLAQKSTLQAPVGPGEAFTIPFAYLKDGHIVIRRSPPVAGAGNLVKDHDRLSPIMRRRLLALERTELALERTRLAFFRTIMAKSRTGMALVRTGIALTGVGMALQQRIHSGSIDILGFAFIAVGIVLVVEGLGWYLSGRKSKLLSQSESEKAGEKSAGWEMLFPPASSEMEQRYRSVPLVMPGTSPGIWGTTGLALERTLLAERRNVMARFRTSHARSRTGMAYLRTAANFVAVGLGLLLTGPARSAGWTVLECGIIAVGILLFSDGLYWIIPAKRERWQLPFCDCQMEISIPDYLKPVTEWQTFILEDGHE